jgi:outer membrane protein assembly factor BamB
MANTTFGGLGEGVEVRAAGRFPPTIVRFPLEAGALAGLDERTVRMFRLDGAARTWHPVWDSGANVAAGYVWARVRRPGLYVPVGLPRDQVLLALIRAVAHRRRLMDDADPGERMEETRRILDSFARAPEAEVENLRVYLAQLELQTTAGTMGPQDLEARRGATRGAVPLPGHADLAEIRGRIRQLDLLPDGLPEELLLLPPEALRVTSQPWPLRASSSASPNQAATSGTPGQLWAGLQLLPWWVFCWLWPPDWPMYHADRSHTGDAQGCSCIDASTVTSLYPLSPVPLAGTAWSVPAIVGGKAYVGTTTSNSGGTLYRVDLATASIDWQLPIPGSGLGGYNSWGDGIGSTPAVYGGRVYFASLDGKVRCIDADTPTMTHWVTDLRHPDLAQNQPCDNSNPPVACWTSPLVVNGKVYVGCGLGEDAPSPPYAAAANFGFVYCLDAGDGHVRWLFCTNKFADVAQNAPNDIPPSLLAGPPPAGFTRHASDPPSRGASVWSSSAYDPVLNRIYVGTGNPNPDHPLPNEEYSSGVLSLDADTGAFQGFFQPDVTDSYRGPYDLDVDMPSSPTLVWGLPRRIAIGSKNGSFFLLDPDGLGLQARRQMLPYYDDDPANPIPTIDWHGSPTTVDENHSGTYSCAAIDYLRGTLFCGLGGWGDSLDSSTTPFLRAMRWDNLADAWPTAVGADQVRRYQIPGSPLYANPGERALSSPAVVNDVVFVATNKPALYALDTATGALLWQAPDLTSGYAEILGPAIAGDYVVIGYQSSLRIYHRFSWVLPPWWWQLPTAGPWPPIPLPGPGPVEGTTTGEHAEER